LHYAFAKVLETGEVVISDEWAGIAILL
jgi:hypothetical protein